MRRLGAGGYRFSIVVAADPADGRGRPNPAGLDFYDRLSTASSRPASSRW